MSKYLPVLLQLWYRLAADPKFKQLVHDILLVEGRWLAGDLAAQDAIQQVFDLVKAYFNPVEFKAL